MQKFEPLNQDQADFILTMLHPDQPCIGYGSATLLFSQKICPDPAKTNRCQLIPRGFSKIRMADLLLGPAY